MKKMNLIDKTATDGAVGSYPSKRSTVVLVMSDYFSPAWRAGGIAAAVSNLQKHFESDATFKFYIFCRARDVDKRLVIPKDRINTWLPLDNGFVFYTDQKISFQTIRELMRQVRPDTVYINGMFSKYFSLYPLLALQGEKRRVRVVLAPHGMLHESALKIRWLKKKLYLTLLNSFGSFKKIIWQATDQQEFLDIQKLAGAKANVSLVPNVPTAPKYLEPLHVKETGSLRVVFLSLISEKKNLMYALRCLTEWNRPVVFKIFGPLKNEHYWKQCQEYISGMPDHIRVSYGGEVKPSLVKGIFQEHDALLLPTTGENFGYAIFECLSIGRPVIISDQTPWRKLEHQQAGFDLPLRKPAAFIDALEKLWQMNDTEIETWRTGAFQVATTYMDNHDFKNTFIKLFSNPLTHQEQPL